MYSFIHSFACTHKGRVQEGKGRDGRITLCKISFVPLRNIWITSPRIDNQDSSIVALSIPSNHTSKLIKCILFSRLWVWAFCWRFSTVAQFWHADRKIKTALGRRIRFSCRQIPPTFAASRTEIVDMDMYRCFVRGVESFPTYGRLSDQKFNGAKKIG